MNQSTLPFGDPIDLVRQPRARHDDPETSKAAARRAKAVQSKHAREILNVLRCAPCAMNAHYIAFLTHLEDGTSLTQVQVARRMKQLLDVGLVVVDGESSEGRRYRIAGGRE